ncbi:hypothetical protein PA25_14690 [Pseudoalteromonas sp. A25]|uniref:DUF4350 domain-containing protein n=1 Tax=Pseudoalteromonas sp. A25 TaxID=116092 RepID=UPI001260406F|nr:DUF4350 domain-containing protein [Pseudoalteromonas sp. A25]BBN81484.1 hypothetical protein PA25_14690 [Pseudoalteromonas sp. A25]
MEKIISFIAVIFCITGHAAQIVDTNFTPKNKSKTIFDNNVVLIDEAHNNFHTLDGRYQPFAKVLRSDGYIVKKNTQKFTLESLNNADVLVIANALSDKNVHNQDLPNFSAFTRDEVEAVYNWVKKGGSLMLIADHLPWPKASDELASIFGFQFNNSYVEVLGNTAQYFELSDGSLAQHEISKGFSETQSISKVRGFMGQAFLIPPSAKPLLVFSKEAIAYMPSKAWQISDETPVISATGWYQGATLKFHKGRVAVFGEAGMFTAQIDIDDDGEWKMGLATKGAEQNEQFLINTMHWLSKK